MIDQSLTLFTKKIAIVLGLSVLGFMAYLAWTPLVWIGIAAFLAVAIHPIILWVQKYMPKKNIGLATFLILALFCIACGGLTWALFAPLVSQATNLAAAMPELIAEAQDLIAATPFADIINTNAGQITNSASQLGNLALSFVSGTVEIVIAFVTIIALMFFMILEGKTIKKGATNLTPAKKRKDVAELGSKVYGIINGYVIGNFLLSMMYGVTSGLLLWMLGNPYFLILGLIAALLDLIPLIGSTIAAILIAVVALLSGQAWVAAIFVIFTIVYVQLENAVLNPLVYSKKVDISPLTVLVAVLIGASIAGVLGTLLAIPVAATIKETSKLLLSYRRQQA